MPRFGRIYPIANKVGGAPAADIATGPTFRGLQPAATGETIVKRCAMLIGMLLLGSVGPSTAGPRNSPDVVYVDGLPCNRFCQFYMARSRAHTDRTAKGRESESNAPLRNRTASVAAARNEMPRAGMVAGLQSGAAAADANTRRANVDDLRSDFDLPDSPRMGTFEDRVMVAAAVAEQLTAMVSAASELKVMSGDRPDQAAVMSPAGGKADFAAPNQAEARVALLMVRAEIKSLRYLTRQTIAIDNERASATSGIQTAFVTEGAPNVLVSTDEKRAIDRLIAGEVPGAIVALVSEDAAKAFPDIAGFKIFRMPLPPGSQS
jgi:hypothetical protein